jgi:hypothetical protein
MTKLPRPAKRRFLTAGRLARAVVWLVIVLGLYAVLGVGGWFFFKANAGQLAGMVSDKVDVGFGELITNGKDTVELTNVRYGDAVKVERVKIALVYDGNKVPKIRSIELERPEVVVTDSLVAGGDDTDTDAEKSEPMDLSWLQVGEVIIRDGKVMVALSGMPAMSSEVDFEGRGIDGASGGALSVEPMHAHLKNVRVDGYGSVEDAEFSVRVPGDLKSVRVERFFVKGAKLALDGLIEGIEIAGDVDVEGGAFDISADGVDSADPAKLIARELSFGDYGFVKEVRVELVPDQLIASGRIDVVHLNEPKVKVDASLIEKIETLLGADDPEATNDLVYSVRDFHVQDGEIESDLGSMMPGIPHVRTDFSASTDADSGKHELRLENLEFRVDGMAEKGFAEGKSIKAVVDLRSLQVDQRIDSVEMEGFDATIGSEVESLMKRMEESSLETETAVPADVPAGADDGKEWIISSFKLDRSRIAVEDMIPGLRRLPFQLNAISLTDVPLSGRDRGDENVQTIAITNLELPSSENPLISVANLPSIKVDFTVPGLFRNEIEKIVIDKPEIFVGEHLFWYVDFYRTFDTETGTKREIAPEPVLPAEAEKPTDDGSIEALEDAFAAVNLSGWKIRKIEASEGEIVVAPRGMPIGIFPFPFSFAIDLDQKKIELALKVEPSDYSFRNIEVDVENLRGESFFNYPVGSRNNNFMQKFSAKQLRYKRFITRDVELVITYDREGIYGQVWAKAYGGDLQGGFDIYLKGTEYKWDVFASVYKAELGPFTEVLAPDTFLMKGSIVADVYAEGVDFRVDNANGRVLAAEGGMMHIKKLDEIIADFPEEWGEIKKMLAKAGLDAFREYDFDVGCAHMDLLGRDGTASLFFDGPDGKRDLQFDFVDKTKKSIEPDSISMTGE